VGEIRVEKSRTARVVLVERIAGQKRARPLPPGGWEHFS
jgi:hypothetical protein